MENYGAFNITLIVDLPLFVDPFLLFNSKEPAYQKLHTHIIDYLKYLRNAAAHGELSEGRLRELFCFPEVRQNWLGFSKTDNAGRGLEMKFARVLAENLNQIFTDFGKERKRPAGHSIAHIFLYGLKTRWRYPKAARGRAT